MSTMQRFLSPQQAAGTVHRRIVANYIIFGSALAQFVYIASHTIMEMDQVAKEAAKFDDIESKLKEEIKKAKETYANKVKYLEDQVQQAINARAATKHVIYELKADFRSSLRLAKKRPSA